MCGSAKSSSRGQRRQPNTRIPGAGKPTKVSPAHVHVEEVPAPEPAPGCVSHQGPDSARNASTSNYVLIDTTRDCSRGPSSSNVGPIARQRTSRPPPGADSNRDVRQVIGQAG